MDLECLIDGACYFVLADSKFDLGFFLKREVLGEEIYEFLWGFSCKRVIDDIKGSGRGLKGVESLYMIMMYIEMCNFRESLKVLYLFLHLID